MAPYCFILATNELDDTRLSDVDLLAGYKGQSQVERGFRFLKDPAFLAASLFLKRRPLTRAWHFFCSTPGMLHIGSVVTADGAKP